MLRCSFLPKKISISLIRTDTSCCSVANSLDVSFLLAVNVTHYMSFYPVVEIVINTPVCAAFSTMKALFPYTLPLFLAATDEGDYAVSRERPAEESVSPLRERPGGHNTNAVRAPSSGPLASPRRVTF